MCVRAGVSVSRVQDTTPQKKVEKVAEILARPEFLDAKLFVDWIKPFIALLQPKKLPKEQRPGLCLAVRVQLWDKMAGMGM